MRTLQLLVLALMATAAKAETIYTSITSAGYFCDDSGEASVGSFAFANGFGYSSRMYGFQCADSQVSLQFDEYGNPMPQWLDIGVFVRRQLFFWVDDNYFSLSTTTTF